MKRIALSVCVFLLLSLSIFTGCEIPAKLGNTVSSQPINTENGWVAGDAFPLIIALPEIADDLPTIQYNDDYSIEFIDEYTGLK